MEVAKTLARAWSGEPDAITMLGHVEERARNAGISEYVIEAAALRALFTSRRDPETALSTARRAARMAQTEELPQLGYLAHLVLAHVRRRAGHPHFAKRIVSSLERAAPALWANWIAWESMMAGYRPGGESEVARACGRMLAQVRATESVRVAASGLELLVNRQGPLLRGEFDSMIQACDAEADDAWARGLTNEFPPFACGIAGISADAGEPLRARALVSARPGLSRRILPLGLPAAVRRGAVQLEQARSRDARTAAGVCALVLSGEDGLTFADWFERVYGFEFVESRHQRTANVLVHRMRKYVSGLGTIYRTETRLFLSVEKMFVVPDPRCTPRAHEEILRTILTHATPVSAREIANSAGSSLRYTQARLKELVHDEYCVCERVGRDIVYRVTDTTFSPPTRSSATAPQ